MSELAVSGVRKSFGPTTVLDGVDLTVGEGELAAVLGPSGCGKTTLLRIVAGFERPDAGSVVIGGRTVAGPQHGLPPERRRVGIVPQEGALFPHLTVAANVGFGLRRRSGRAARVADVLDLVGLDGYGQRMPHELSGGQQQRVALARALAPEPALVLLDEPFSALDTGLRAALRADVRSVLRAAGTTAVLVTHDQQEALSVADVVAVLHAGRILQEASPAELYAAPRDLAVAMFVGEAVVLDGAVRDGAADCALGRLPLRPGSAASGPGSVVIRPEQVLIGPAGSGIAARVVGRSYFGHDALVTLRLAGRDGELPPIRARTQGGEPPAEGADVGVTIDGEVSFFPSGAR